jgi:DNA recombination protein RmuC
MFMPIEPAYIEAMKYEKDLFSYGYERGIVMVSHTTLIPILRTVSNLWSMERSTREARELGDKAGDIYNQVRVVAERLGRLGKSLQAANNHFNLTATALTGHQGLHGKVERFADMSSKVTKSIPLIEPQHSDLQTESLQLLAEPIVAVDGADEDAPHGAQKDGEDSDDEPVEERQQTVSST